MSAIQFYNNNSDAITIPGVKTVYKYPGRYTYPARPTTIDAGSSVQFAQSNSDVFKSGICNWQAAFVASEANTELEFHLTGAYTADAPGDTNETSSSAVVNGLQIIPVVDFLQPSVITNDPLEYELPAGTYALMHVQGAVNLQTSDPKYAGGWYRLVHSTVNNPPTLLRVNFPEVNRYTTGTAASMAYSGKQYLFTHAGGFIEFSFDDHPNQDTASHIAGTLAPTTKYISHGVAYTDATYNEPIAPVFALISIDAIANQNSTTNPVLYTPSSCLYIPSGTLVSLYTTTGDADIYYTYSTALAGVIPPEPTDPLLSVDGTLLNGTLKYSAPILVSQPTKFKAFARRAGSLDSPLSSAYYTSVVNSY